MVEILQLTDTGRAIAPRLALEELVAPELLDAEVAAAYRRSVIHGDATIDDAMLALAVLREWDIERIPHRDLSIESSKWWPNATAYDAMYLAVALIRGATVLTIDGPLSRAPIADVVVENVRVGPPV